MIEERPDGLVVHLARSKTINWGRRRDRRSLWLEHGDVPGAQLIARGLRRLS